VKPLLLASTSRYKQALFAKLGVPFETAAPPFEERLVAGVAPPEQALRLAEGKARSLADQWPDHLIIGADQILAVGDRILTKPGSVAAAVDQLVGLSGRTHALHTAFAILEASSGKVFGDVVTANITFFDNLDRAFLRTLVTRDETTDCVGGYKFEEGGILLMERVETPDPNAIVGLPLIALIAGLRRWGWFDERFAD